MRLAISALLLVASNALAVEIEICASLTERLQRIAREAADAAETYRSRPGRSELETLQLRLKDLDYHLVRTKKACDVRDLLQLGEPIRLDSPTQKLPR